MEEHQSAFQALVVARDDVEAAADRHLLMIPQVDRDDNRVDTVDRIQVAAKVVKALVDAGC